MCSNDNQAVQGLDIQMDDWPDTVQYILSMDQASKKDFYLLFITRSIRLFSYGSLSVVLFLYLAEMGFKEFEIGKLLTYILLGDLAITMWLTTSADRFGRKKTLVIGALLKLFTGVVFAVSQNYWLLILSGIIGVISTTGGEIGPFISVEQAALTELKENMSSGDIATLFGWYNLFGYFSQAMGALFTGLLTSYLIRHDCSKIWAYRIILITYAIWGWVKFVLYSCLSSKVQAKTFQQQNQGGDKTSGQKTLWFGVKRKSSLKALIQLSLMFALDAFAGGFVMQTFLSYWFEKQWDFDMASLGGILMFVNVISGISGLYASTLVNKIGAMPTMIVTHLPSNILLILIPIMPNATLAVAMLFARFCISTMDVPARQTYVATVVDSDQRSAAGGITNVARTLGLCMSPLLLGKIVDVKSADGKISSLPFFIAGGLKIVYDLTLCFCYLMKRQGEPVKPQSVQTPRQEQSFDLIKQIDEALNEDVQDL